MRAFLALLLCVAPHAARGDADPTIWSIRDTVPASEHVGQHLRAIAVGASGDIYVGGTISTGPAADTNLVTREGTGAAYVARFDPTGARVFRTLLAPATNGIPDAIAVDSDGNVIVVSTVRRLHSVSMPVSVSKLDASGALLFTKRLGVESGFSAPNDVAVDLDGDIYVTGHTNSEEFPTTPNALKPEYRRESTFSTDAFVAKLAGEDGRLLYGSYFGGSELNCMSHPRCVYTGNTDEGVAIALDPSGDFYVVGWTSNRELPTSTGAVNEAGSIFVVRLSSTGDEVGFVAKFGGAPDNSTFGPNPGTWPLAASVAADGTLTIAGTTGSPTFPATSGSHKPELGRPCLDCKYPLDAFVLRLSPKGERILAATYVGGASDDRPTGMAVTPSGSIVLSGYRYGPSPVGHPNEESYSAFLTTLDERLEYVESTQTMPFEIGGGSVRVHAGQLITVPFSPIRRTVHRMDRLSTSKPVIVSVADAATTEVSGRVAPSQIVSIRGVGLGPEEPVSAPGSARLTELGGTSVEMNGVAASLLYVQAQQINARVPAQLAGSDQIRIRVTLREQTSAERVLTTRTRRVEVFPAPAGEFDTVQFGGVPMRPAQSSNKLGFAYGRRSGRAALVGTEVSVFASGHPDGADGLQVWVDGTEANILTVKTPAGWPDGVTKVTFVVPEVSSCDLDGQPNALQLGVGEHISYPVALFVRCFPDD